MHGSTDHLRGYIMPLQLDERCTIDTLALPNSRVYRYEVFRPAFEAFESSEITGSTRVNVRATCKRPQHMD